MFYVLLEGRLRIAKRVGDGEMLIGTFTPGMFFGELPLLLGTPFVASGRALSPCRLFRLRPDAFWQMLSMCPIITQTILRTLVERVRNLESIAQNQEKLVSLGTMAAGLAHELNNPAAATRRAAHQLREALDTGQALTLALGEQPPHSDEEFQVSGVLLTQILGEAAERARQFAHSGAHLLDSLAESDREEELTDWMDAREIEDGWKLAPAFVHAGLDAAWLDAVAARVPAARLPDVLPWLEAQLAAEGLLDEVESSVTRLATLVTAVKAFSRTCEEAPPEPVDVHEGLDSTLLLLGHKLRAKKITVERLYDRSLPPLCAYGSELNQVWTNLLDNAIDAIAERDAPGSGRIRVCTAREGDRVLVEITDNGPGIPPEIRKRLFEPFFTTKEVGKGTGLGLVTSYRIVAERHHGEIHVHSEPGDTRFEVRLPLTREGGSRDVR